MPPDYDIHRENPSGLPVVQPGETVSDSARINALRKSLTDDTKIANNFVSLCKHASASPMPGPTFVNSGSASHPIFSVAGGKPPTSLNPHMIVGPDYRPSSPEEAASVLNTITGFGPRDVTAPLFTRGANPVMYPPVAGALQAGVSMPVSSLYQFMSDPAAEAALRRQAPTNVQRYNNLPAVKNTRMPQISGLFGNFDATTDTSNNVWRMFMPKFMH